MRWSSRKGWTAGSSVVRTTTPSSRLASTSPANGDRPRSKSDRVEPSRGVVARGQPAQCACGDDLAPEPMCGELAPDPGDAGLGREHLDSGHLHDLRDGAPGRHADPAPGRPVDREGARARAVTPEAAGDLAQQVVGSAVVGLPGVAEPCGHGGEDDRRIDRQVSRSAPDVEPAVGLDVVHEVELAGRPSPGGPGSPPRRRRAAGGRRGRWTPGCGRTPRHGPASVRSTE